MGSSVMFVTCTAQTEINYTFLRVFPLKSYFNGAYLSNLLSAIARSKRRVIRGILVGGGADL